MRPIPQRFPRGWFGHKYATRINMDKLDQRLLKITTDANRAPPIPRRLPPIPADAPDKIRRVFGMPSGTHVPARALVDEDYAVAWFYKLRWPDGPVTCPECSSHQLSARPEYSDVGRGYRCQNCLYEFSLRTGTVMHASKIDYTLWAMLADALIRNPYTTSTAVAKHLAVTQTTAWRLCRKVRDRAGIVPPNQSKKQPVSVSEKRHEGYKV